MHCLRAAVALMAAVVFSLDAAGQTSRGVAIYTERAGGTGTAIPFQPLTTLTKTIKRYGDPNKGDLKIIVGALEYNRVDCSFIESGTWTDPNPVQAKDKNGNLVTLGTVDATQTFKANISGTGTKCDGAGPYDFRAIKFIWNLHRNLTGIPNKGPTAVFNSSWSSKDHCCDFQFTFNISVPVVRPNGEAISVSFPPWDQWFASGTVAQFDQQLQCCDAGNNGDPTFDFTGEWITERFPTTSFGCPTGPLTPPQEVNAAAPPAEAAAEAKQSSKGSSWDVGSDNKWGPDGVGFGAVGVVEYCTIHYARCVKPKGCFNSVNQQMYITSPADRGYDPSVTPQQRDQSVYGTYIAPESYDIAPYGQVNHMAWGTSGPGLPLPRDATGPVSVTKRDTSITKDYTSHLYQCPQFYKVPTNTKPPRYILPPSCQ